MEFTGGLVEIGPFRAVTWGIVVLFIGRWLVHRSSFLRDYNIPEPVVGGLLFSLLFALLYFALDVTVQFDLAARDFFLVYFFTTIGLNAKVSDLVAGGKPLAILLGATVGYMFVQNLTGIGIATLFGLPGQVGLLGGTVSLIGGHGTAIAWAPTFAKDYGIENAMEIGIACATFGLVLASTMGGPIAKYLIGKHRLKPTQREGLDVGVGFVEEERAHIDYVSFLQAVLAIQISITLGFVINEGVAQAGIKLPLFVTSLFAGIVLSNTVPRLLPKVTWPSRSPSLALIADIALGVFLAMSLMSMQLWTLIDLAAPLLTILIAQFLIAASLTLFVIFRIMGSNYDAAVVCAGFGGISLGSTATAMANMTAVTHRYGPSHLAFIIVPLVCAFFIDLVNVFMIQFFLGRL